MPALRLFLLTLAFPLFGLVVLWRRPRQPIGGWLATVFLALGVTAFSFLAAPWGVFGLPMRYLLGILFVAALVTSWRRAPSPDAKPESPFRSIMKVLVAFFFGGVALGVLQARAVPPGAIDLSFPLRGGAFLVEHGGSTSAANMYNADAKQRYAVDLVKLNGAGMRAYGLFPNSVASYAIFAAGVFSPCDGIVRAATDSLPDQEIGTADAQHPLGNHVILRCGDVDVTLAHLRRGRTVVRLGARVARGAQIGQVGNSGGTTEPHLHIDAERNGAAVPMTFDGQWLVRNNVVRRPSQPAAR